MFTRSKDTQVEVAEESFGAEYMGGHTAYAKKRDCTVNFGLKHMNIEFGRIHKNVLAIPYGSIISVENEDEKRITKTRVLLTGFVVGLLWKKKFRYTVIEYVDKLGIKQGVVIDFHRSAEKAQQLLYQKMVRAKEDEALR